MSFFYARLVTHRAGFPANMTPEEAAAMQGHATFVGEQLTKGTLVVAGPVLDPAGVFGLGIFEAASLDEVKALLATDPANAVGRYEALPMRPAMARPARKSDYDASS
jgi:uncharacterized protein YciI